MNSLLQRQIGRLFQDHGFDDPRMRAFLEVVGKTYDELEENKDFFAHTLEVASAELTEANERLSRESESRLRHISDYFEETLALQPNIIFRCKREGDGFAVGLARGRLLMQLGLKPADLEHEGILPLVGEPAKLEYFQLAWQGEDQRFEMAFEHAQLICHFWLHPLMEAGRVVELIGIVSDVTRQKAAEDRLRQTSEALERRAQEQEKSRQVMLSMIEDLDQSRASIARERDRANTLAAEAAAANRAKSDFLATMSHEIRTPMNGVLGFTQILQQGNLSAEQRDFITSIRSSAESLLRVINDVLDFSKIDSGYMTIEATPFGLQSCIEESLETVSTSAAEKGIDLVARVAPGVPASVTGDPMRLRQVLVNLLGNAVKFTQSGEVKAEVGATPAGGDKVCLEFSISDTGIGISPDRLDHLFQPFHQEDSSISRRFGGSGLGLAICRRLVEMMGGTISVSSRPSGGSVFSFRITLPVSNEPPAMVGPVPFPDFVGKRALLVDGHPLSRQVVAELLERWGIDLRSAASADEAATLPHGWQPQVLLLDSGCSGPADVAFANRLFHQGVKVLLLCQPGDGATPRERLGDAVAATLFKPLKVSPLFNSLLAVFFSPAHSMPAEHRCSLAPIQQHGRPLRLLLAEDNAINRKLALAALAQMGCTADIAADGHEALQAATTTRYDAILMDVQMPGMDGLEATRAIRRWETASGVTPARIIAVTANALAGDRDVCLNAGMDDYLPKPIRLETLRAALQKAGSPTALGSAEDAAAPSLAMAALCQLADDLSAEDATALATDFMADLQPQLDAIRNAIGLHNADEARRLAHSLKGTASIFALHGLQSAAGRIEKTCRDGLLADAESDWPILHQAAQDAVAELQPAIDAVASTAYLAPMS